jgi:hypothetical protein
LPGVWNTLPIYVVGAWWGSEEELKVVRSQGGWGRKEYKIRELAVLGS